MMKKTCDGWHLYAVDYCLSAKEQGFGVYALPMEIYHLSRGADNKKKFQSIRGPLPDEYYEILDKLIKKYSDMYTRIYTTCGDWSTSYPAVLQRSYYMQRLIVHLDKIFNSRSNL
ncbi:hypothetical protein [Methanosarcina barkeri]|uniref:hypothetical protein n=1 Tax=Methanosarcina barkeri TaxID=2208 RepID=UPI001FB24A7D|nr:hypothetical protein [Methanosarcina barkeri]